MMISIIEPLHQIDFYGSGVFDNRTLLYSLLWLIRGSDPFTSGNMLCDIKCTYCCCSLGSFGKQDEDIPYHFSPKTIVGRNLSFFRDNSKIHEFQREVFRTRCTETMPLPLCCLILLVSAEWLLYGIVIDDIYIKVLNSFGINI